MEHITMEIKGRYTKYADIMADVGYCFYEKDVEDRIYMQRISTPILTESEFAEHFIVVQGNADELNEQLNREREKENAENDR